MQQDRWQHIMQVFQAALDRDEASRASFLDVECQHDEMFRAEVEALIAAHQEAGSFGERPIVLPAQELLSTTSTILGEPLGRGRPDATRCSQCGRELVSERGVPGWCAQCLLSLALPDPALADGLFPLGRIVGERYQIVEVLGRGGMGEVFRALDLKLRVHVALKAIRAERIGTARARETLRREVRSAREVMSPNVCRIFDLVVAGEEELVSMEYVDGTTLADLLRGRGRLPFQETREIAFQFLSGLDAIHRAGLVHRDFKPENIMVTGAGRVVVMDFGLANVPTEESGRTIAGTPAYMAPEQSRGDSVNARADVFAAGIVLTEMLAPEFGGDSWTREAVWRAVREAPPRVPDGPWAPVLRRALEPDPGARYESAHALARALEGVALRLPGFEQNRPYPGLAAFTAEEAPYFFGREVETEKLLKKLERPRLLALIGPSGAGKSSFLRAGLLPALPPLWQAVVVTPGTDPFRSLAQALAPLFAGDAEAVQALLRFDEEDTVVRLLQRLRHHHESALLIVDQFEELFTLNAISVQSSFARLLGRLVVDADIRVLLSLRDDFLIHCQAHEALTPAFSDLTPLGVLGESALRRALVQPALACGYRFEDDSLIDDMLQEVSQDRGALPLLAFAAARLWEKRDRDAGLLTRAAYRDIGGVAGALAHHAEATLEQIGRDRAPLVRELFRNLVTSQGTRAVRAREDLLSVFHQDVDGDHRSQAEGVVDTLVNARLLNSYTSTSDDTGGRQQIEIVHESLLIAWPRLVQWRAQDAEGAQVRDQLRQASQLWQDRGRTEDLLWSGTTYREFLLWRERYPGALTATETAFTKATDRLASRKRRRSRLVVAGLLVVASAVAITSSALWQRSETSRQRAEAEAQRAEAGRLLAIAEREIDRYPTAALAYAIKSLELADTEAARLFTLRLLQQRPVAQLVRVPSGSGLSNQVGDSIDFSPNGEWVAWGTMQNAMLQSRDGGAQIPIGNIQQGLGVPRVRFDPHGDLVVATRSGSVRAWSVPDGRELRHGDSGPGPLSLRLLWMGRDAFMTLTAAGPQGTIRAWPFSSADGRLVGTMDLGGRVDATSRTLAYTQGRAIYVRSLLDWKVPPRLVGEQDSLRELALSGDDAHLATSDGTREIAIWPTTRFSSGPERRLAAPASVVGLRYDPAGKWLSALSFDRGFPKIALFDLTAPDGFEPLVLSKGDTNNFGDLAFHPSGSVLATTHGLEVAFWPLDHSRGMTIDSDAPAAAVAFSADGTMSALMANGTVRTYAIGPGTSTNRTVPLKQPLLRFLVRDPGTRRVAVSGAGGYVAVIDTDDGSVHPLRGFPTSMLVGRPAFSRDGRLVAAGLLGGTQKSKVVRVWDSTTGEVRTFDSLPGTGAQLTGGIASVHFAAPDRLLASILGTGIVAIDLNTGANSLVVPQTVGDMVISRDGRFGVGVPAFWDATRGEGGSQLVRFDLDTGAVDPVPSHGTAVIAAALSPDNTLVATASFDGTIRIGPVSGQEPYLLLGQEGEGAIYSLAFSPDGRWLAASGESFSIHLWPVPDASKPPMQTWPHDDLLSLLRRQTNLRAVPEPTSSTGYRLSPEAFRGWGTGSTR